MRVMPPTRTTWSMSAPVTPASSITCLVGPTVRSSSGETSSTSFDRVSRWSRCLGPDASAVTNGRLICVSCVVESSTLAFSAAS